MKTPSVKFTTVDEYFAAFPAEAKNLLKQMRKIIKEAAPQAQELISYNMPAFKQDGALVYYAAYKNHIGFYPTASGIKNFQKELSGYEPSKGAIRFPIDQPLPVTLIKKIVKFRVTENKARAISKAKK